MTKQTKHAVKLLLAASAVSARPGLYGNAGINGIFPDWIGSTSSFSTIVVPFSFEKGTATTNVKYTTAPISNATELENFGCVACVRNGSMWCAGAYLSELGATDGTGSNGTTWDTTVSIASSGDSNTDITIKTAVAAGTDLGQCCMKPPMQLADVAQIKQFYSPSVVIATASATGAIPLIQNKYVCWARYKNDSTNLAGAVFANGGYAAESRTYDSSAKAAGTSTTIAQVTGTCWCSSGVTNTSSTATAFFQPTVQVAQQGTTGWSTTSGSTQNEIGDPRTELILMNCRQKVNVCGGTSLVVSQTAINTETSTGAQTRTVSSTKMNMYEKCTWVYVATNGAPTFNVTANGTAVLNAGYDLHYAEYTSNATFAPTIVATSSQPSMGSDWTKLMARVYDFSNQKGIATLPNVWMWESVSAASTAAGYQQKRWFPVQMAIDALAVQNTAISAFTTASSTYTTSKTAYDSKVTEWNDVVNQKPDFFKDLFTPPKKVVLPNRPNMPEPPAAYTGPYLAPYAATYATQTATYYDAIADAATRAPQGAFVVGPQMGGWGGWTMGMLPHATTALPVWKSFGVFGYGTTAADQSFVWAVNQMCISTTNTGSNGYCLKTGTANTTKAVVAVSIWANAGTTPAFNAGSPNNSGMKIIFSTQNWKQYATTWAKPSTQTALTAPSNPIFKGGKALLASATTAAALAAALY